MVRSVSTGATNNKDKLFESDIHSEFKERLETQNYPMSRASLKALLNTWVTQITNDISTNP